MYVLSTHDRDRVSMIFEYLREPQEFMNELTRNTFKRLHRALFCILLKCLRGRLWHTIYQILLSLYNKIGALFSYVNYDAEEVEA